MTKALCIENLKKTYANHKQALKGINLDVMEGDFFALLGPNGAGKSTTIGIISSLVNKTSGKVKIFGYDLDKELTQAKSCLGIVPQEINFSQFENCFDIVVNQAGYYGLDNKLAKERTEKYLTQLGLWERRHDVSRTLSGGLKRRLMIARALVHEPKLLILDEPTAGVDVELRRSMWDFLTKINQEGITIVLTTHYLEEAERLCRNIAIIDQGEIIQNTSMRGLLGQLHKETIILDLDTAVNKVPKLPNYDLQRLDEHCFEVTISKEHNLNELFSELSSLGIVVNGVRNKSNRLEELFINLVEPNQNAQ